MRSVISTVILLTIRVADHILAWAYEHDLPMDDGEPDLDYEFGSDRHQTEPWSQEEEEKWNFEMYGTKECKCFLSY